MGRTHSDGNDDARLAIVSEWQRDTANCCYATVVGEVTPGTRATSGLDLVPCADTKTREINDLKLENHHFREMWHDSGPIGAAS
ncbi:hypothetical protein ACX9R5_18640 [Rathayibacter sp. CAU 1779]